MTAPLLLLPGMMCDARLFEPQIAALSEGRTVSVPSLSGAQTIADLASRILAQAPAQFALAGLSMGGIVAMEIMRQAADRVTHLALLDTNALADAPEKAPIRAAQMDKVRAGGLRAVMRDEMKPAYLAEGPNRAQVLDLCMAMAEDLGPQVFLDQTLALLHRADQRDVLAEVQVPSLVLCGREDQLCPVAAHTAMADLIPGAELAVVDGAGHLPPLEQPQITTQLLVAWLAR